MYSKYPLQRQIKTENINPRAMSHKTNHHFIFLLQHKFHPKCIDEWLKAHDTCPMCRCSIFTQPVVRSTATHTENALNEQRPLVDGPSVSTVAPSSGSVESTSTQRPSRVSVDVVTPPHREMSRIIMTRSRTAAFAQQSAEQRAIHVRTTRQTSRRQQQDEQRQNRS